MDSFPKIDRELDLREQADADYLLELFGETPGYSGLSSQDIKAGIETLTKFFPDANWLHLSPYMAGILAVPTGKKSTLGLDLADAIRLGFRLTRLESCEGFYDFMQGFANPSQFTSSMFEAEIAEYCLSLQNCSSLKLSPSYIIRGIEKRPDFEFCTPEGEIVCECKNAHESETRYQKNLNRILSAFDRAIKRVGGLDSSLRLEVHLTEVIAGNVDKLADKVISGLHQTIKCDLEQPLELGAFLACFTKRSSPIKFNEFNFRCYLVSVGNTPTGITPENAYLHITTNRLDRKRVRAAGDLLREAKAQLPETKRCAIFIRVNDGVSAVKAAHNKLKNSAYRHILVCGVWSLKSSEIVYRDPERSTVERIFGPFQAT